jgi:release factor glutamine methyltransferase
MTDDDTAESAGGESCQDPDSDRPALAEQRDVETVYQAAEDSRLLAETVVDRLDGSELVLDVGTGSGYIASRIRDETGADVLASDVNPHACRQARERGLSVVRANMFEPFCDDSFDVVVCNPPYLPTPPDQEWDDWMEAALSGGEDGHAMVDPFLRGVGRVLKPGGRAYLLISTLTGPEEVGRVADASGLSTTEIASESYPFERLLVLEIEQLPEQS